MPESFGARLRQQRERRRITLASIAEETKIKESLLEALERDDVSNWPSGIFRRAFIRSYAQAIGAEADALVREFLDLYPDPADPPARVGGDPIGQGPQTRLRSFVASAVSTLAQLPQLRLHAANGAFANLLVPVGAPAPAPIEAPLPIEEPLPDSVEGQFAAGGEAQTSVEAAAQFEMPPDASFDGVAQVESPPAAPADAPAPIDEPLGSVDDASTELALIGEPAAAVDDASVAPAEPQVAPVNGSWVVQDGATSGPDLSALAEVCTGLARAVDAREVEALMQAAAGIFDAVGLIVWTWDPQTMTLKPAFACGYSRDVLARLPMVRPNAENATAATFRAAEARIVNSNGVGPGAVVVPLLAPAGCLGVLAIEVRSGAERREWLPPLAAVLGAQLAALVGPLPLVEAVNA